QLALELFDEGILKNAFNAEPEYLRLAEAERKLREKLDKKEKSAEGAGSEEC
ncbi:MAG: hypothetical protein GX975_01595, partial [Clostridiales bacterium]|nr:hypothetical protein [Clostridiales bacterium]